MPPGAQNTVCCFFCDGRINSWQPNDDPMTEHRRRFSQCGFLRLTSEAEDERTAATESSHEVNTALSLYQCKQLCCTPQCDPESYNLSQPNVPCFDISLNIADV